jgi:hypothetical protein
LIKDAKRFLLSLLCTMKSNIKNLNNNIMKTQLLNKLKNLAVCSMLVLGLQSKAQDYLDLKNLYSAQQKMYSPTKIGVGADQYVSCDLHGGYYNPYLTLSHGKNMIAFGPVIQKRGLEMNGGKFSYSRVLTGGNNFDVDSEGEVVDGLFQLNFFCSAQLVKNAQMSYSSVIIEERTNRNSDMNWSALKLTTAEVSTGFELHVKLTRNINWKNYFGVCVYDHVNYQQGMYHDKAAAVLTLGTGIVIKSFTR